MRTSLSTYIYSSFTGIAVTRLLAFLLAGILGPSYLQLATWFSWAIFIPGLVIYAKNYTGNSPDGYYGVENNPSIGTFHAGKTWESTGNTNSGLLDSDTTTFGLTPILFYGGIAALFLRVLFQV